jgi:hypothetical protein
MALLPAVRLSDAGGLTANGCPATDERGSTNAVTNLHQQGLSRI